MVNNNYYLPTLFYAISDSGYSPVSLDIVSFLAILSSILVITSSNQVISVLFLISLFINISIYLILLEISFIALTYVIVYVGAVTILFLFVIMLLNIKLSEVLKDNSTLPYGTILGIIFLYPLFLAVSKKSYTENNYIYMDYGVATRDSAARFFNYLNNILIKFFGENNSFALNEKFDYNNRKQSPIELNNLYNEDSSLYTSISIEDAASNLDKITTILWDNTLSSYTQVSNIGHIMYSSYVIWFFIVSLILLLAMVGSISLTLRSNNNYIYQ